MATLDEEAQENGGSDVLVEFYSFAPVRLVCKVNLIHFMSLCVRACVCFYGTTVERRCT